MPTTRSQAAEQEKGGVTAKENGHSNGHAHPKKPASKKRAPASKRGKGKVAKKEEEHEPETGEKRGAVVVKDDGEEKEQSTEEPPAKKAKMEEKNGGRKNYERLTGTIERGHIYFFYRTKVQMEEAHSIDDVKDLQMLLVPRPPEFAVASTSNEKKTEKKDPDESEDAAMKVVEPGADAIPAPEKLDDPRKKYRTIVVGKKKLPDPEQGSRGRSRNQVFWATVAAVGDDLSSLEKGLGEKTYETKTRGTRHEEPARLAARGAYALVNNIPDVPSKAATHFGYVISHPSEMGEVQHELGIQKTACFVLQVKNPLAPATGPQQVHSKGADYPNEILTEVFGKGGKKGRENYGLRFTDCRFPELLDYEGGELLLIADTTTEEGLEEKLGEGRGEALEKLEEKEAKETTERIFQELAMDNEKFPADPLEGEWI